PFADPPPGSGQFPAVPLPITGLLWCLASVACLAGGVSALAGALEEASPALAARTRPVGNFRWWALRLVPVVVCAPGIYETIDRAQVGLMLTALTCAMIAAALRGKRLRAGL